MSMKGVLFYMAQKINDSLQAGLIDYIKNILREFNKGDKNISNIDIPVLFSLEYDKATEEERLYCDYIILFLGNICKEYKEQTETFDRRNLKIELILKDLLESEMERQKEEETENHIKSISEEKAKAEEKIKDINTLLDNIKKCDVYCRTEEEKENLYNKIHIVRKKVNDILNEKERIVETTYKNLFSISIPGGNIQKENTMLEDWLTGLYQQKEGLRSLLNGAIESFYSAYSCTLASEILLKQYNISLNYKLMNPRHLMSYNITSSSIKKLYENVKKETLKRLRKDKLHNDFNNYRNIKKDYKKLFEDIEKQKSFITTVTLFNKIDFDINQSQYPSYKVAQIKSKVMQELRCLYAENS